ncbi:exodeoxyribonuclease V subunit alpha [Sedimenticola sp.]|uniref:exodeoxyribonuclease V subunit alpha n=1 Tax=Sedimenticola sp. TaxID=1940285 RepID=UPI003D0A6F4B
MSQSMELLKGLKALALLTDLDLQFAALMGRLADDQRPELLFAAAQTCHRSNAGDVCLPLSEWCGRRIGASEGHIQLPDLEAWMRLLRESSVVGGPGDYRPLILDQAGRLYLQRYWAYEERLADQLLVRSRGTVSIDQDRLRQGLDLLFPPQPEVTIDWQKVAAAVAVQKQWSVISGGPGTGKTSTVVRILALLQEQADDRPLVIALTAPTGKAAARLQDAIQRARADLPVDPELLATIPTQAMTLHRLMGNRQGSVQFRHDAANPLPVDLLVIDEASMVDVALMAKVVDALPAGARLILLGDRNQLASVEAGAVLGDICGDTLGFTPVFRQTLEQLTALSLPPEEGAVNPLADTVVQLRHSYRFGAHSGIGRLAELVNSGESEAAGQLLQQEDLTDIRLLEKSEDPVAFAVAAYRLYLKRIAEGVAVETVFADFDAFRVLCVLRSGPTGVVMLNQQIRRQLVNEGWIPDGSTLGYPGRPVMITRNDHNLRLYNGDVGIFVPDESGKLQVCFQTADGIRRVNPSRLPPHETAFAMTVHKSQGSEFDRVLLVLPEHESPLLSRELIYTGLTRSRREFLLSDPQGLLAPAIAKRTTRASGLQEKLWGRGRSGDGECDVNHQ